MFSGSFLLDPIGGTVVSNELRRLETKLFEADWAEAKERLGRDPLISELARTSDQRRADLPRVLRGTGLPLPGRPHPAWSEGGITDQHNGRLACGCHNRLRQKRPPPPPPDEAGG